jgi:hypothetical protein
MSLTGLPLILLVGLAAVIVVAATVRGWNVPGRKRVPLRTAGLVTIEVLVVAGIGLVVNRHDDFYPSWQALGGGVEVTVVPAAAPGRLDGPLDSDGAITWSPPGAAAWHLAAAPLLIAPPEYAKCATDTFPVIVALTTPAGLAGTRRAAAAATGALTVVLQPTRDTTAAALATLPGLLGADARVAGGLAVLAEPAWTALASAWPGHPAVVTGPAEAAFTAAARGLPAPLGRPQRLPS